MKDKIRNIIDYGEKVKQLYQDCHIQAYSAQAAFFFIFSAVPTVMLGIIMFGYLFPFEITMVNDFLSDIFIDSARATALKYFQEILNHSTIPLASITMIFLIWAATKGVRSIGSGLNAIYDNDDNYNFFQFAARSAIYTIVMVLIALVSMVILVFTEPIQNLVETFLGHKADFILALINMRNIIFFFAFALLFALAYATLTRSELKLKNHFPGAFIASGGWLIYSYGYSIYIKYFSKYSSIYGSLGAVMLFMLWLYMCMNILLCGALFNKVRAKGYEIK